MANNKVQLANGTVLIDITDTTANASDVLSGEYFYDASGVKTEGSLTIPSTYTVTKTLTNVTTNNNDTEVLAGGSFYMDLTPSSGMVINSITVTMGGVDVTEQVFKAGVGEKIITQNGVYDAEDDWLEGYSSVNVNVQNSYTSSDEGKVVNNGSLVSQTSATYTTNNTYDTTLINSVTVNVSGGITPTGTKEINITENGTVTEDVTNYANVEITTNVSSGSDIEFVEYIQTDGSAWLDTGVKANQTSIIDCVFYGTATSSILYGCASSGNTASVSLVVNGSTASNCRFGNRAASAAVSINTLQSTHQKSSVFCYGTTYKTYTASSNFETPKTLLLGAMYNTSGGVDSWHFQGRIYCFHHVKGGAVVFDGRPAKKNNVYGIYDTVSKTFLPSITGTSFTGHDYS